MKAVYQFMLFEFANSMCTYISDDGVEHFVIGTAYMNDEDAEPQRGRIILLSYDKGWNVVKNHPFLLYQKLDVINIHLVSTFHLKSKFGL